jgi:hypothetical protein
LVPIALVENTRPGAAFQLNDRRRCFRPIT